MTFLRSRRLAAVLLVGLTLYSWVATLAAPGSGDLPADATVAPFVAGLMRAVGLVHPFSSPVFIVGILLVALSTAACAWERTRAVVRGLSATDTASNERERLLQSPRFVVAIDDPLLDGGQAIEAARVVLRRFRLKTRVSDGVLAGNGGFLGLAGSALFHWALVGLFVFAGLGQLTRYEGYANVIQGRSMRDSAAAYDADLTRGALFGGRFSGLTLGVADINLDLRVGGVARGDAALVTLSDGGREIKRQWVYPNSPLRYGSLLVHRAVSEAVFLGSIRTDGSSDSRKVTLYFDLTARAPREFSLTDESGNTVRVAVAPAGGRKVAIVVKNGSTAATSTVGIGGGAEIRKGQHLIVDDLTYAAQLHVVNDSSIPWLYAMFALGSIGAGAAVLIPARTVSLAVVGGDADETRVEAPAPTRLYVRYRHRRNDPAFPRLLEQALTEAVGGDHGVERAEDDA